MQSAGSQAQYRHSTEPGPGVGRIRSPQARPAWPARMPGPEADHPCAQPRTNRRTQAQRARCRPMTQSRHSSAIEPVSRASLGNDDTAQPSAPRKQEGERESAFMTPSCGNSSTCLASRLASALRRPAALDGTLCEQRPPQRPAPARMMCRRAMRESAGTSRNRGC